MDYSRKQLSESERAKRELRREYNAKVRERDQQRRAARRFKLAQVQGVSR